MRLGCCAGLDQADEVKQAGFDFLEVNVQQVLRGEVADEAWAAEASDPGSLPLPIEAANCLVPGHLPVVGPKRDLAALRSYMARVGQRAGQLGIRRLVFGSGGARKRPEGTDALQAMDQLVEFGRLAGDACGPHGVLIVVEHLRRQETNTINSLEQLLELVERINHPHVAALVDSYHFGIEGDTHDALVALGDRLAHVHVAEPASRVPPGEADPAGAGGERFDFATFFGLLQQIGYDERVSIEATFPRPIAEAGPATLAYLRDAWSTAARADA